MNIATDIALVLLAEVASCSAISRTVDTGSDNVGEAVLLPILILAILRRLSAGRYGADRHVGQSIASLGTDFSRHVIDNGETCSGGFGQQLR